MNKEQLYDALTQIDDDLLDLSKNESCDSIYKKDIENNMSKKLSIKKVFMATTAMVACLAVFVTGLFAGGVFKHEPNVTDTSQSSTPSQSTISKIAPGFVMVAYADEKSVDLMANSINIKTPMKSKIGAIDIRGKSQAEVDEIVEQLYKEHNLVDWSFPSYEEDNKNVLTLLDTNTTTYNNAIQYQFRNGFFDFDLDEETAKNVKEIRATNENRKMAYINISSLDAYYDKNGNLEDDYTMYSQGIHRGNMWFEGDDPNYDEVYANLSGERYRRDLELSKKYGRLFGISWQISTEMVRILNENPNYDLTQIKDTLTFEVEFNDGSISKSVVDISLDKDGYIFAKPASCEYIQ